MLLNTQIFSVPHVALRLTFSPILFPIPIHSHRFLLLSTHSYFPISTNISDKRHYFYCLRLQFHIRQKRSWTDSFVSRFSDLQNFREPLSSFSARLLLEEPFLWREFFPENALDCHRKYKFVPECYVQCTQICILQLVLCCMRLRPSCDEKK